jgi:hypothetical protein
VWCPAGDSKDVNICRSPFFCLLLQLEAFLSVELQSSMARLSRLHNS